MSMSKYAKELANIDFSNPEDIFDFSARLLSEEEDDCYITHYSTPLDYSKLPRKLIAEPCVKLSDLQSMTNCSNNNYREAECHKVKIHCTRCGSGFIYPNQQNAGEQLFYCPKCRGNFSRQIAPAPADHVPCHQTEKMHCCVCGQVFEDLARFIYHCQSHDEREYHKVCAQPHIAVEPPPLVAVPTNESNECINSGKKNPANDEADILIIKNPIYSPSSTLPLVNHSTVSPFSFSSTGYFSPSHQMVYYNQMLHYNQMALHQRYLKMQLYQSTNRTRN